MTWLTEAIETVEREPAKIGRLFPAAGRHTGSAHADEARVEMLKALPLRGDALTVEVRALYRYGDAAEKRAVLLALPHLDVGASCVDLLRDALRTNDTRLVAAALGPYATHLDAEAWRQGVLKCVFMGVPLENVHDLDRRADAELGVMLGDLHAERTAAGRTLADDAVALLGRLR